MTKIDLIYDVLTSDECDKIVNNISEKVKKSKVVDRDTGESVDHSARTSYDYFVNRGEEEIVDKIGDRVAREFDLNLNQFESFCYLEYDIGNEYKAHFDYFQPGNNSYDIHLKRGGQRIMTALTYLSDDFEGGGTTFPKLNLTIKPKKGTTIIFRSFGNDGELDSNVLHSGDPVISGKKKVIVTFIREKKFV